MRQESSPEELIVAADQVLMACWQDLKSWLQLARRQREMMDQNLGWCPTEAGIKETEKILLRIESVRQGVEIRRIVQSQEA
jgi:hypothetical protein